MECTYFRSVIEVAPVVGRRRHFRVSLGYRSMHASEGVGVSVTSFCVILGSLVLLFRFIVTNLYLGFHT